MAAVPSVPGCVVPEGGGTAASGCVGDEGRGEQRIDGIFAINEVVDGEVSLGAGRAAQVGGVGLVGDALEKAGDVHVHLG